MNYYNPHIKVIIKWHINFNEQSLVFYPHGKKVLSALFHIRELQEPMIRISSVCLPSIHFTQRTRLSLLLWLWVAMIFVKTCNLLSVLSIHICISICFKYIICAVQVIYSYSITSVVERNTHSLAN